MYDVQIAFMKGELGLRGKFGTDEEGRYLFRSIKPSSYPIPQDGPVGKLMDQLGRHPYRPAHIHFVVSAEGYVPVVMEIFAKGDPYLDSDVVFGVKDSLIAEFRKVDAPEELDRYGFQSPFYKVEFNFDLRGASEGER